MAREHQILVGVAAMCDVLQRFLDAEAARVGEAAGRVGLGVLPRRKSAMRQAAHAVGLILADDVARGRGFEDERRIGCLERLGIALFEPAARLSIGSFRDPVIAALHDEIELVDMLTAFDLRKIDLALGARFEAAQEGIAHRRRVEARR